MGNTNVWHSHMHAGSAKQVVDVQDLVKAVLEPEEPRVVQWLCHVRNADAQGTSVSKACDAVLGTLVRLFCARYISRSVTHLEHFEALVRACCDDAIDRNKRYQRLANVCAYLANNPRKPETVHVYPGLASAIPEVDAQLQQPRRKAVSPAKLARAYGGYVLARARELQERGELCADCTRAWLAQGEHLSPPQYADVLCLLEHSLLNRDAKSSHRVCTYVLAACPDLCTPTMRDAPECLWKVLLMCLDAVQPGLDVQRYVRSCRDLFFASLPAKRKARECRLALLYYSMLVVCDGRTRAAHEELPLTYATINLPVTFDGNMMYLTIFPRLP